jgi:hypothetical protein
VPVIAAVHYPLGNVNSGAGYVGLVVHVGHLVNRPAVNAHPNVKVWVILQSFADFDGASDRPFRIITENERSSIARRQAQQFPSAFGDAELRGSAHNLHQLSNLLGLLINQQLRVTDNIDKQNMTDLEPYVGGMFGHAWLLFTTRR